LLTNKKDINIYRERFNIIEISRTIYNKSTYSKLRKSINNINYKWLYIVYNAKIYMK